ncbi:MAG: ABC transporter substrate-binding protein [Chloroflexi bacterium]|nr:ABC transporter substrate-binding protein [Chloroflexota bacterium]
MRFSWSRLWSILAGSALWMAACTAPAQPQAGRDQPPPAATSSATAPSPPAQGRAAYPAPTDEVTKVRAAWCAVAGAMFPLWVAKEAGIFERHRLDVELSYAQGAGPNLAALGYGDLDFLECAGGATIPAMMAGGDAVFIATFHQGNPYRVIVSPDITSPAELRGRKMAISRPGEFDNRLVMIFLERHGLVPNVDVTLVPIGGQTDRYNALKGGIVDGTSVNPPVNLTAQNEGFREIYDIADLGVAGVYISLFTNRQTLQNRPRLVERFLAAMTEAAAYARANREFTIKTMGDYLKLNDQQALAGAWEVYADRMLSLPPRVPVEGVQAVIDESLSVNPTAPVRDATAMIAPGPLQAVEASGFVDAVLTEYGFPRR